MLLAGGFLAVEGWAYWQERSARQAMAEEQFDEAQRLIDSALLVRDGVGFDPLAGRPNRPTAGGVFRGRAASEPMPLNSTG